MITKGSLWAYKLNNYSALCIVLGMTRNHYVHIVKFHSDGLQYTHWYTSGFLATWKEL